MLETAAARYQQVRATTSTPGELLIALYDGLFRFLNGARVCLERKERPRASELLSKSYAIVSELYIALDHNVAPELCAQLEGLYGFCMDRITFANIHGNPEAVAEVIRVLTPLREAWKIAVPQAAQEAAAAARGR
jgi:flagellar protein FliS